MNKIVPSFILLSCIVLSCNDNHKPDQPLVGSLVWLDESYSDSVIKNTLTEFLNHSNLITAQISWSPYDSKWHTDLEWYSKLAEQHNRVLMINIDWMDNNRTQTRGGWSFNNDTVKAKFIKDVIELNDVCKPSILNLAVEANYYALHDSNGYKEFINIYNFLKPQLKENNPQVSIGLTFQVELLLGTHKNWGQIACLEPLDAVIKNIDCIGLSTYPDISTSQMSDYFDELSGFVATLDTRVAIAETGIKNSSHKKEERLQFIKDIYELSTKNDFKYINWVSLIDKQDTVDWSYDVGLIDHQGIVKPDFELWSTLNDRFLR
jgi:hypothetical protein